MLRAAAPRLVGRHASAAIAAPVTRAPSSSTFFFAARRAAAASPFSSMAALHYQRQSAAAPAIRFLAIKHTGNRLTGPQRSALVTRFSTSSSSTPASSSSGSGGASQNVVAVAEKSMTQFERLKDLWRKYGIVAIGTYFSMYGVVLGSIYVAIDQGWVRTTKPTKAEGDDEFNLVTATNKFVTLAEKLGIDKYLEVERVNAKTGTFLIAWIATKFTEPVRLAVTLAITPRVARFFGRAPQLKPKVRKP